MRRTQPTLLLVLVLVTLAGCARSRPARMRFEEVWARPAEVQARPPSPPPPQARSTPAPDATDLHAMLLRFGAQARATRAAAERGAPMPPGQAQSWGAVLGEVEAFLARPAHRCSPDDVVRAHAILSAELELEAGRYGDVPEALALRIREQVGRLGARMSEVRRLGVRARTAVRFRWPLSTVTITSLFGPRLHPVTGSWRHHSGVDLAAEKGQEVTAAAEGVVVFAGWHGGHGRHVEIHHPGRVITRYSHLSALLVEEGFRIKRGEVVGLAGASGEATGVHLHFELLRNGRPQDPLDALPPVPPPDSSDAVAAR